MFKNYRPLWLILAVAMLIFAGMEVAKPLHIGGHELKPASIVKTLTAPAEPAQAAASATLTADTTAMGSVTATEKPEFPAEPDTASKVIMFIGDSMLEGLSPRLAAYAEENGHTLYTVMWYSSTSQIWGASGKITSYIKKLNPDYIFICLGANELFVANIAEKRDKYVKKMVEEMGDIPFVWIGPPNWREDTGINDLIKKNVPKGNFFLSNGMKFNRAKDGAHPTRSSAIEWMDSVARWMPQHAAHPIKMKTPSQKTGHPKRIFVHQPSEK